jgi:WD40 repeat protein
MSFSADGQMLASGSADETVRVWDLTTGKEQHAHSRFHRFLYKGYYKKSVIVAVSQKSICIDASSARFN